METEIDMNTAQQLTAALDQTLQLIDEYLVELEKDTYTLDDETEV